MIEHCTNVRVRYAETDKMGFVYYGRYLEWFEVGRTEMLRAMGLPYSTIESDGLLLPVIEAYCKYRKSATYDEVVQIVSSLAEVPKMKIRINYKILNETDELLAEGYTIHIFLTRDGKPVRPPKYFTDLIQKKLSGT